MGLVARNPEHDRIEQGAGEVMGTPPTYATGEVYHDALGDDGEVTHHLQQFDRGELVGWQLRSEPGPWALVRPGAPSQRCPTQRASAADVAAVGVRIGDHLHPLPPLDDLPNPAFDELDYVPDATARLRFELSGTPVGRILCDLRYQDGRRPFGRVVQQWVEETSPDEPAHDAPLIDVAITFANYLRMRTGEMTSLEAIADGGDVGETRWTLLLLLHGIVQTERYVDAYRALPVLPPELGWWGEAAPYIPADAVPR